MYDIWTTPILPPPPGITSNFIDPPSRGPMIRNGMCSILAIMIVFIGLRVYTRAFYKGPFAIDDYLSFVAAASVAAYTGVVLAILDNPEGRHAWDIPIGMVITKAYPLVGSGHVQMMRDHQLTASRLPSPRSSSTRICIRSDMPLWASLMALPVCRDNIWVIAKVQIWFSALLDFYIVAIPIWLVWGMTMSPRRRAGVMGVFLTGLASLELCISIICSCMPVIVVVLKRFVAQLKSTLNSVKNYTSKSSPRTTNDQSLPPHHLPDNVPKGNMTGLRTFIRNIYRTNNNTKTVESSASGTIDSVSDNYHVQLKEMRGNVHSHDEEKGLPSPPR
ncbi:hypothetical protein QBC37DRAFT_406721 [Rhypophila decipiens]|uniref:Integral membrane protein n=1 Tax=Rhypophila decipiens TaxID=261697 RepID=A0AAN7B1J8_9PEZI|nr:hypothetical protein QBC37DRAFT_406721 [Rhypophila decipiens]